MFQRILQAWQPNATESLICLMLDDLKRTLLRYVRVGKHLQGSPSGKLALQSSQRTFSGDGAISILIDADLYSEYRWSVEINCGNRIDLNVLSFVQARSWPVEGTFKPKMTLS